MNSDFASRFEDYEITAYSLALLEIRTEICEKASEIFALYYDSLAGYELLKLNLPNWKAEHAQNLNSVGFYCDDDTWVTIDTLLLNPPPHGKGLPYVEFAQTLKDYRNRIIHSGRNAQLIGRYLIIALYQYWEDRWRGRIASALGTSHSNILSDYWGELRLIRHCLTHNNGIAGRDLVNKCKMFRWFSDGQPIILDQDRIEAVIAGLFQFMYIELMHYGPKSRKAAQGFE